LRNNFASLDDPFVLQHRRVLPRSVWPCRVDALSAFQSSTKTLDRAQCRSFVRRPTDALNRTLGITSVFRRVLFVFPVLEFDFLDWCWDRDRGAKRFDVFRDDLDGVGDDGSFVDRERVFGEEHRGLGHWSGAG